ncbi:MAG: glycerophosphodiester phosphodiesterase [Erythrobacter sp.]|nr:glycerophosphodiester phosphodiesterase [Erythrobacter sp.]MBA4081716.1 glycerophosphodiester phosphodiesterase [Erythrobacter sp.]
MMRPAIILAAALAVAAPVTAQDSEMLIIAHRGASAERPEHTLAAYERAIDQGADYIEPDLVATKDLVLVARHENELSGTTDVASREEFEDRRRDKTIDGQKIAGWFAEDFTLAELRTLRAKERIPSLRPANARYDGLYQVPTLADIVKLVRAKKAETGKRIGLYPELKHPSFLLQNAGIDLVDLLLRDFRVLGITAADPVFIQSFEIAPLQRLKARGGGFKLVQLVAPGEGPADEPAMRYAEMVTPTGLVEVAKYADAVGAFAGMILTDEGEPTSLVADAHAAGLKVHAWTLRIENDFLPMRFRRPGEGGEGCYNKLFAALRKAGVDGVFTDSPKQIVAERKGVVWNGWCAPE